MRRFSLLFPLMLLLCIGCSGLTIVPSEGGAVAPEYTPPVTPSVTPQVSPCCPGVCPQASPTPESVEVLVFTAKWCGPCQRDKPKLAELRATGVKVTVIDIDKNPKLKRKYGVKRVPTYIVFQDGVEIQRTGSITLVLTIIAAILKAVLPLVLPLLL